MSRLVVFAVLFACLFYVLQASPVPQEAASTTGESSPSELEKLASRAKDIFDTARVAVEKQLDEWRNNTDINAALEKSKAFLNKAGDGIRREVEKIGEQINPSAS